MRSELSELPKKEIHFGKVSALGDPPEPHPPHILSTPLRELHSLSLTLLELLKRVATRAATRRRETIGLIEVDTVVILIASQKI
jgi:hypothetical protein